MRCFALAVLFLAVTVAPVPAADLQFTISIRDRAFFPAEITVPAGTKVELIVKNEQAVNAEFESKSLHREKLIAAGGQVTLSIGPVEPGSYEFFDDFNRAARGRLIAKQR